MYNFIAAMLSIALLGLLSFVAISYTGVIFSERGGQGTVRAQIVTLINNGQQVAGAQRLHAIRNSGLFATTYETLIDEGYLQALPTLPTGAVIASWSMSADGGVSKIPLSLDAENQSGSAAEKICAALSDFGGISFRNAAGASPGPEDLPDARFGCVTDPGATSVNDADTVWFVYLN